MMNRRRFLAVSAAALGAPATAQPTEWRGHAMGAEVSLTFDANPEAAASAITKVQALLDRAESLFSLYRPDSDLVRLNQTGILVNPAPEMLELLSICDWAHGRTGGRFDPTVQPLWLAAANGRNLDAARELIGWDRVRISEDRIVLGQGQQLTMNGIAQGFVTDLVANTLRNAGWTNVLVNIGEYYAAGRIWRLGVSDPVHGIVQTVRLRDRAIATSSPSVLRLSPVHLHILNAKNERPALWSTVSVEAANAAMADALSTALCHVPASEIADILSLSKGNPKAICTHESGEVSIFYS
ncbi:FAD:protein FMN transferase [Ruegeria lacuscaerulensis]|uniref:FAD:protein FMN transferase n=2 Tax=Ruegeria lacuscaerulensis TaxID=55218 RepID=UPI00147C6BCE|nr:FAD:protein FMN transferase [Ruegeria lacuscaerulensis]